MPRLCTGEVGLGPRSGSCLVTRSVTEWVTRSGLQLMQNLKAGSIGVLDSRKSPPAYPRAYFRELAAYIA
ncbi:MAG: hypothetical protein ACO331_08640 [Prochlorothrix sp.]